MRIVTLTTLTWMLMLTSTAQTATIAPQLIRPLPGADYLQSNPLKVTLRFEQPPNSDQVDQLIKMGVTPARLPSGKLVRVGPVIVASVPRQSLLKLTTIKSLIRVEPAHALMRKPPLDITTAQIEAPSVWRAARTAQTGSVGDGITVADLEGSWDIFHPDFFRPDGGFFTVADANGDGRITAGDRVDLDQDGIVDATLSLLESGLTEDFQLNEDWLYVDTNGNGTRDFGAAFTEETPGLGEPIFVADDIDQDGTLREREKLIQLGTSKVRAVSFDGRLYERGQDLTEYPRQLILDTPYTDMGHGTGAAGIVAAGSPTHRRVTGVSPGVDLVLLPSWGEVVTSIAQAQELGVNVMFHEWNDWHNFQDGSTNVDVAISAAADQGMIQVAPAGNLAGASHVMEILNLNQDTTTARLSTDSLGWYSFHAAWVTFTWVGEPGDVAFSIPHDDGTDQLIRPSEDFLSTGTLNVWVDFDQSERGTTKLQLVIDAGGSVIPEMEIPFTITTTTSVERIRGLVSDDQSGWGQGISWIDHISDHGTALSPATADQVIAVAAYGGTQDWGDFGAPGERRGYSGMGPRIDGEPLIDIASPDDPISPACYDGDYAVYGRFGGTSGATPHVAGAAALLLGSGQFSGHTDVETALKEAAQADELTGPTPNEEVGYGKMRLAQLLNLQSEPTQKPSITSEVHWDSDCEFATITALVTDPDGDPAKAQVYWDIGYNGLESEEQSQTYVIPPTANPQTLVVRVIDEHGDQHRERIDLDLSDYPCEAVPLRDDGCACTTSSAMPLFAVLGTMLLRRRRSVTHRP